MTAEAANHVLNWASSIKDARFCLLEQFLPDGQYHPFAATMLQHFKKLQTPLQSVQSYPTLRDQERRFTDAGWRSVVTKTLWDLWGDAGFIGENEKNALDQIEPFDEWEELALFTSHYFIAIADVSSASKKPSVFGMSDMAQLNGSVAALAESQSQLQTLSRPNPKGQGLRRFAVPLRLREAALANHGGIGTMSRLGTSDVFIDSEKTKIHIDSPTVGPSPRMCHTSTLLDTYRSLVVGGRTSPDSAKSDCWLFDSRTNTWQEQMSLPVARYRHCATRVGDGEVFVYGGKDSQGEVLADWLIWSREAGWLEVHAVGPCPQGRFGAVMIMIDSRRGMLIGGMAQTGAILVECWEWTLHRDGKLEVSFRDRSPGLSQIPGGLKCYGRFGAILTSSPWGLLTIGGVIHSGMLNHEDDLLVFEPESLSVARLSRCLASPRPLLIGCSVFATGDQVVLFGGGAVCFSFGTFWNTGVWTLSNQHSNEAPWCLQDKIETLPTDLPTEIDSPNATLRVDKSTKPILVPTVRITSSEDFEQIIQQGKPVIISDLDIGPCTDLWCNTSYLSEKVGRERIVTVHAAQTTHMTFTPTKNFTYERIPFATFLASASAGEKLYLRSISTASPSNTPTSLATDFPGLAPDFHLPPALAFAGRNMHSSPLRISGPVSMWLHYDVMANLLIPIAGPSKTLLLYPPSAHPHLSFPPTSSTSPLNPFLNPPSLPSSPQNTMTPHRAIVPPGSALFIPALWPHAVAAPPSGSIPSSPSPPPPTSLPTTSPPESSTTRLSTAINIFFRALPPHTYAPGRDVYGNRDLAAYEEARRDVERMRKRFAGLPVEVRRFYAAKLAGEVRDVVSSAGEERG
ncbi:MAG: tRNA methyltransferase ppm2 [Piccolia ochrophora]|nr:MAG: tRNA methyltransferase ppm2 [Piccolia ochrophora]